MLNARKGMVKAYCVQSPGPSVISRPFLRRTFPCLGKRILPHLPVMIDSNDRRNG